MSIPTVPDPARLIVSIITPDSRVLDVLAKELPRNLGPVDETVGPLPFDFTDYYDKEMGSGSRRWLWAFQRLVDRAHLASMKLLTNEVEQAYTSGGNRRFNLDPGLLTLENFDLATGKNRSHRIYLGEGIFGDLTLVFMKGAYRTLEWTYPDYADSEMITVLGRLREKYKWQLTELQKQTEPYGA